MEKNRRVYTRRTKKKRTFTCAYTSVEKKKEATREKNAKERKVTGINTPSCLMRGVPGRECIFLDSNKIPEN